MKKLEKKMRERRKVYEEKERRLVTAPTPSFSAQTHDESEEMAGRKKVSLGATTSR